MSKVLSGIKKSDLNKIDDSSKVNSIVTMLSTSLSKNVDLTSSQRADMLNSLTSSLKIITGSTDPSVYLNNLTTTQLQSLYPIFIEADSTLLNGFSKLDKFSTVISQVASMKSSKCCSYSRAARKTFASYAVSYLVYLIILIKTIFIYLII